MSVTLANRLDHILPRVTSKEFLASKGIGNEIACYIFDYAAADELLVRDHIQMMLKWLASNHRGLHVLHLNLLEVCLDYLERRGLLEKAIALQQTKDDVAVLRALKGPLAAEKIRDFIASEHKPADYDLLFISGVGSVWPMLRAHSLLNCLHPIMGDTPLVMFYPGSFDGTTLRLFDQIAASSTSQGSKPYYRAFILVPSGKEA